MCVNLSFCALPIFTLSLISQSLEIWGMFTSLLASFSIPDGWPHFCLVAPLSALHLLRDLIVQSSNISIPPLLYSASLPTHQSQQRLQQPPCCKYECRKVISDPPSAHISPPLSVLWLHPTPSLPLSITFELTTDEGVVDPCTF